MSSIFGGVISEQVVTLDSTQTILGKKRFLNVDNELTGSLVQPTIEAMNEFIDPTELSFLSGTSSNIQAQFEGVNSGLQDLEQSLQTWKPASAFTADTATYATSAGSATSATTADTATYATSAGSATSATTANTATSATTADTATTAVTQLLTDSSTKIATTAFVKAIAAPSNFLGLANSFYHSFIYSNNPNPDYMIASNLGGLNPVVAGAILSPGSLTFILLGVRLQAGITFNRYGWNQNGDHSVRCALFTSQFVYVPNSLSAYTGISIPLNTGGKIEIGTSAPVTLATTDTYYIYMDGETGNPSGSTVYGATSTNFNLMNYTDLSSAAFTLTSSTEPFKVATGTRLAGSSPATTMTDLKVSNPNMTYTAYVLGVFLRLVL